MGAEKQGGGFKNELLVEYMTVDGMTADGGCKAIS